MVRYIPDALITDLRDSGKDIWATLTRDTRKRMESNQSQHL